MQKRKELKDPPIRQNPLSAIITLETYAKGTDVEMRKMVDRLLRIDTIQHGPHSEEFLQAYFSAIMFVREWLMNANCPSEAIKLVSAFAAEFANHYHEAFERRVCNMSRMV